MAGNLYVREGADRYPWEVGGFSEETITLLEEACATVVNRGSVAQRWEKYCTTQDVIEALCGANSGSMVERVLRRLGEDRESLEKLMVKRKEALPSFALEIRPVERPALTKPLKELLECLQEKCLTKRRVVTNQRLLIALLLYLMPTSECRRVC